jgi:hypothetical protein
LSIVPYGRSRFQVYRLVYDRQMLRSHKLPEVIAVADIYGTYEHLLKYTSLRGPISCPIRPGNKLFQSLCVTTAPLPKVTDSQLPQVVEFPPSQELRGLQAISSNRPHITVASQCSDRCVVYSRREGCLFCRTCGMQSRFSIFWC